MWNTAIEGEALGKDASRTNCERRSRSPQRRHSLPRLRANCPYCPGTHGGHDRDEVNDLDALGYAHQFLELPSPSSDKFASLCPAAVFGSPSTD